MGIYIVLCVVTALLTLALFYALFKLIWYAREMLLLSRSLKAAERAGAVVTRKRGLFAPLFKQKGEVDFTVDTNGRQYAVSVLSFICGLLLSAHIAEQSPFAEFGIAFDTIRHTSSLLFRRG